jgi:hypothetical protein
MKRFNQDMPDQVWNAVCGGLDSIVRHTQGLTTQQIMQNAALVQEAMNFLNNAVVDAPEAVKESQPAEEVHQPAGRHDNPRVSRKRR